MSDAMKQKKVIWAIDPREKETRPAPGVLKEFFDWMKASRYAIQPVHVFGMSRIDPREIDDGTWLARSVPAAEEAATRYLSDLGVTGTLPVQVPLCAAHSQSKAVQRLLEFAEAEEASVIALSSHGRSGLDRLALGSFAENVLLQSISPVLFLNSSSGDVAAPRIQKILFPTDLSKNSKAAFRLLLPQVRALGAELIVFYAVALPPYAVSGPGLSGYADPGVPDEYFETQAAWATEELKDWVAEADALGVVSRELVKEVGVTNEIGNAILSIADEEKVQLIAMASLSGAFKSWVAGSVARDVFRTRRYPVWVCGPKAVSDLAPEKSSVLSNHEAREAKEEL